MKRKKASTQKTSLTSTDESGAEVFAPEEVCPNKRASNKPSDRLKKQAEKNLKYKVVEDIFNNYSLNSSRIYKVNFMRGLFFGAGSVIGGTVGVALLVWFLSLFIEWPVFGEAIQHFIETLTRAT